VSPFYDVKKVKEVLEAAAATINADPQGVLANFGNQYHGPHSKYVVPSIELTGRVDMKVNEGAENGIACNLESPGFKALVKATGDVLGSVEPYSIGGSLPLVRDMQDDGFDIQIAGYGFAARYHADNECASISALGSATKIIARICSMLEAQY
jgi:acetylornithine deacetylase